MMHTADRLLMLLAAGQPQSQTDLCAALAIRPAALQQALQQLRNQGISLQQIAPEIYQLSEPLELLDKSKIFQALSPLAREQLGDFEIVPSIDSTNAYLLNSTQQAGFNLCLAEYQTAGRGRQGKQWISPYASGLCLSVKYRYPHLKQALTGLNLALAISTVKALWKLGATSTRIKWPNDIWWEGRKLAGLLLETRGMSTHQDVVMGIGMNLNLPADMPAVDQPLADLKTILGREISRNLVAAQIINHWVETFLNYPQTGLEAYADDWQAFDLLRGQVVQIHTATEIVTGTAVGIDAAGALLVQVGQGLQRYLYGEVSVRL
jgi:BirA family biotin operon repressor/biotin-[acetyl-CoA-carboxylase] ligase